MAQSFLYGLQAIDKNSSEIMLWVDRSITEIEIPQGVTSIGAYAFSYCTKLSKISIPEGVKSIGANALNATALTELVLPLSCEAIHSYSLYNIATLTSITFGDIKTIGSHALGANRRCTTYDFTRCTTVPTLANVEALANINPNAKIYVPTELYGEWVAATNWSEYADHITCKASEGLEYEYNDNYGCYAVIGKGSCTDSMIVIPPKYDDGDHGELNVTVIGNYEINSFNQDLNIVEVHMPSITTIDGYPLEGCSNLKKLYMPSVLLLNSFLFCGLTSLEYVKFGKFDYDYSCIGGGCFGGSQNVTFDFSDSVKVPELVDSAFGDNPRIIVPDHLVEVWRADTNWSEIADRIYGVSEVDL